MFKLGMEERLTDSYSVPGMHIARFFLRWFSNFYSVGQASITESDGGDSGSRPPLTSGCGPALKACKRLRFSR